MVVVVAVIAGETVVVTALIVFGVVSAVAASGMVDVGAVSAVAVDRSASVVGVGSLCGAWLVATGATYAASAL